MKKIVAILCLLAMVLPLAACSSGLATEDTNAETREEIKKTEEAEEKGEIVYPGSFAVGYAAGDITGTLPIPIFDEIGTSLADPLMLTCTAVWDGKTAVLLMSADLRSMTNTTAERSAQIIEKQFGIPKENIIINCTHTHSAPQGGEAGDNGSRWLSNYYKQLPIIVEKALRDLDVVEGTYTGKGYTKNLCFVRRYLMPDGTYKTNPGSQTVVAHETEADPELRTIRIDRKNKKDILMVNYQTHYVGGIGAGKVSADFVGPFRVSAEKEFDCHFVYHQGAGANINFFSSIPGERIYNSYTEAADAFVATTKAALAKEEVIEVGEIKVVSRDLTVTVQKDPMERVEAAQKVMAGSDQTELSTLAAQYGFESWRAANSTLNRYSKGETEEMPLTAISFGEIAFATAPIEMFDTNGKEVRDGSPFKTTFICSLTNGAMGYVPSAYAFPHGTYEVLACAYVPGTGEQISGELVKMLNECKSAS